MSNKNSLNFLEGNMRSLLLKIAIPSSLGFFFSTINNLVDQYWAGQIGLDATTALGRSFPFVMFIISVSVGLSSGSGALIANWLGQKKEETAEHYQAQAISLAIFIYLVLFIPMIWTIEPILRFMGAEGEVLRRSVNYTVVIYWTGFILTTGQAFDSGLRARGLTKYLGISYTISAIGNFLLNPLLSQGVFINGVQWIPKMEEIGLAYSTAITSALGAIYLGFIVVQKGTLRKLHMKDFLPNWTIWGDIFRQMLPATLSMTVFSFSIFVTQYFIKAATGSEFAIAASTLGFRVEQFAYMPTVGFNIAMGAIIGQNNGARIYSRIHEAVKQGFFLRFVYLLVAMIIISYFLAEVLVGFFVVSTAPNRDEVIMLGALYLHFSFINVFFYGTVDNMAAMLQGIKKPEMVPVVTFYRMIVAPIAIYSVVLWLGGGYREILIASLFVNASGAIWLYLYGVRKLRKEENLYLLAELENQVAETH